MPDNTNVVQLLPGPKETPLGESLDPVEVADHIQDFVAWFREKGYEFHYLTVRWQDFDNYISEIGAMPYKEDGKAVVIEREHGEDNSPG